MPNERFDVVVVGSGPSGLAAAASACRVGLRVALVDPNDAIEVDEMDGRAVALTAAARDRLIDLDLWAPLSASTWPTRGVRVYDTRNGIEHIHRIGQPGRGALLYVASYPQFKHALAIALSRVAANVEWRFRRRLTALHREGDTHCATLDDGQTLRARLVVGADGRRSIVRELAGLSCRLTDYPSSAIAFVVESERLEADTALERLTRDGPIAFLPLGGGRFAVTWIGSAQTALRRRSLSGPQLVEELIEASGFETPGRLRLVSGVVAQRLSLAHPDRYVAPGLVLVGDAAHGGHPVPAQGFNMAIADVHELAVLWRGDAQRFASGETLARFQRSRRLANAARLGPTDIFNRMFAANSAPYALMRGAKACLKASPTMVPARIEPSHDGQLAG